MRWLVPIALVACAAVGIAFAVDPGSAPTRPVIHAAPPRVRAKPKPAPVRPPQFVVVSFDGSGGGQMWSYWDSVARRADAHFTFFVSGVYLIDWAHRMRYRPPQHDRGTSAIGFSLPTGDLTVAKTFAGLEAGYRDGNEIGTHFNGHFCGPGGVGDWTAADWRSELDQFDSFLFDSGTKLPFGQDEIVGDRTPCLEGNLNALYPVLKQDGFRYDASRIAPLGTWPKRIDGIWSFPLAEIPFVGHTFPVISMDYNLFANQVDYSPASAEQQSYASFWNAFRTSYLGNRAPLAIGQHFETWDSWAYDHALTRFVLAACLLPEVRCVSYRQLANFLDSVPPKRLKSYEGGRFPRFEPSAKTANEPLVNLFSTAGIDRLRRWRLVATG